MNQLTLADINASSLSNYVTWVYNDNAGHGEIQPYAHSNEDWIATCSDCGTRVDSVIDTRSDWDGGIVSGVESEIDDGVYRYEHADTPICRDCVERTTSSWGGWETHEADHETVVSKYGKNPSETVLELGKMQRAVLLAMLDHWDGSHPSEFEGWVKRVDVTRQIASADYHSATSTNSLYASVSRAVHSLIDRGLLTGAYRAWHTYHGDSPPMNAHEDQPWSGDQGDSPFDGNQNDNPTIEKVRLRMDGLRAGALISEYLNGGATPR
ncbi:hypothetical protein [Halorientalis marina]|uniref:hypothetical protein n=1 Tax=Halorientalis marina TaxID=2931976 RepID=UPI001FF61EAB|nr:hypothetical protein [Halorientalis marina]